MDAQLVAFEGADPGVVAPQGRVLLCGPIVARGTLLDVVSMLDASKWTGELHVRAPAARYRLTLHQGGLQNASSSLSEHRLGELLVEAGTVSRVGLSRCIEQLDGQTRIGELLVRRGAITRDALFEALRSQAQKIFYRALTVGTGTFLFTELVADAEPPPIAFHLPIQHLLLEGARRLDERQRAHLDAASDLVVAFSAVLRHIFASAQGYGHGEEIHRRVAHWIQGSGLQELIGADLRADGSIDPTLLLRHVQRSSIDQPVASLYQMLHDLTTFVLFAAGPTLPRPFELELAGQVTRALRQIEIPRTQPGC